MRGASASSRVAGSWTAPPLREKRGRAAERPRGRRVGEEVGRKGEERERERRERERRRRRM